MITHSDQPLPGKAHWHCFGCTYYGIESPFHAIPADHQGKELIPRKVVLGREAFQRVLEEFDQAGSTSTSRSRSTVHAHLSLIRAATLSERPQESSSCHSA
jgi:hypothetical protein